jgi:hypothetical protein
MSWQIAERVVDWRRVSAALMAEGYAVTEPLLSPEDCVRLGGYYDDAKIEFRSTINMARYNFGRGEYKYFAYPLPSEVQHLREFFYAGLAPIANEWEQHFGKSPKWPNALSELVKQCHAEGQCRPTPLMLRYREGDYNCLHQDLYGAIHFPLQVVVMLSAPQDDFAGGELILVEQRPRMQSRPIVVNLEQGAAAIIPVRERPRKGIRGYHRAKMRHGVGRITAGNRNTLGVIFHDAE